jgi:hypothetical protein
MNKILFGIWVFCYSVLAHANLISEHGFLFVQDTHGELVEIVDTRTLAFCERLKVKAMKIDSNKNKKYTCTDINDD